MENDSQHVYCMDTYWIMAWRKLEFYHMGNFDFSDYVYGKSWTKEISGSIKIFSQSVYDFSDSNYLGDFCNYELIPVANLSGQNVSIFWHAEGCMYQSKGLCHLFVAVRNCIYFSNYWKYKVACTLVSYE